MEELKEQIKKYCLDKIEPYAESDDHHSLFRMDIFQGLGNLGLAGISTAENYGGLELGYNNLSIALEEVAKYSVSYAVTLSVSAMVQSIIEKYGDEDQKRKYLPDLAAGKIIGAFALTESSAGSDAASLKTSAKKQTDGSYKLHGNKMFITSGGIAKVYVVMARTGIDGHKGISAFIVEDGTPGFSYGKLENKMGWKVSPTRELIFDNCLIKSSQLLSKEGEGFKIALSALDRGRITIGAVAIGLAQKSLDVAIKYALERKQFNQPIYDFQGLQFLIAELATEIEAARGLVYRAASLFDQGKMNIKIASMAKLKATDVAMKITTEAVQILGGVGYTQEYPVERYMRDAKVLQIVEGTNQIQKIVIAKNLKMEYT